VQAVLFILAGSSQRCSNIPVVKTTAGMLSLSTTPWLADEGAHITRQEEEVCGMKYE
jgi:hypothetical protein